MNLDHPAWAGVTPIECPRCKKPKLHPEQVLNALSRRDNETYICSPCGTEEAMIDLVASQERAWLRREEA